MQSLNQSVALAQAEDRRRHAAARRAQAPPWRSPAPPGWRPSRAGAMLAARVARRLDAEAAERVLSA